MFYPRPIAVILCTLLVSPELSGEPLGPASFFNTKISPKALEMIEAAEEVIILSIFLFDNFYAEGETTRDIVGTLTGKVLGRLRANPEWTPVADVSRMRFHLAIEIGE